MISQIAPYFGYLASLFLILALIVSGEFRFKIYSLLGNVSFIIYGIIFHAWPVLLTNGILLCINIYYLQKLFRKQENFDQLEFTGSEKLVEKFLYYNREDIAAYFPAFQQQDLIGNFNFVVLRDLVIANIFSAHISPEGDACISVNYTTAKYRDYKVGRFIFEKEKAFLHAKGVKRLVYKTVSNKAHIIFLKKMGFEKEGESFLKIL